MMELVTKIYMEPQMSYPIETCRVPDTSLAGSTGNGYASARWCHSFCCSSTFCDLGHRCPATLAERSPKTTRFNSV